MQSSKYIIPLLFLIAGFIGAYFVFLPPTLSIESSPTETNDNDRPVQPADYGRANPFLPIDNSVVDADRIQILEIEVSQIKEQLQDIKMELQQQNNQSSKANTLQTPVSDMNPLSAMNQRLYSIDNLIRGGIDQSLAEDIVRRKNSIELKKLQLQDRAKRENYYNTRRYFNELEALDENNTSLRDELGEEQYDSYLYNSRQNNRVRINSVMLGSAAEQAGILKGDVILSYDDSKLYTWQELKNATSEGELGEFVSVSVLRNGEIFSFTVPRGPLGIQLGATRIQP